MDNEPTSRIDGLSLVNFNYKIVECVHQKNCVFVDKAKTMGLTINQQRKAMGFDPITINEQEELVMDKLTIKDLQKGMKVKVQADDSRYHGMVLIVDYVSVSPDYMVRTSYAVAIDETGWAHLLTNDSKLILDKEKEKDKGTSIPFTCPDCGKQTDITLTWELSGYNLID